MIIKKVKWIFLLLMGFQYGQAQPFIDNPLLDLWFHKGQLDSIELYIDSLTKLDRVKNSEDIKYWKNRVNYGLGDYQSVNNYIDSLGNRLPKSHKLYVRQMILAGQIKTALYQLDTASFFFNEAYHNTKNEIQKAITLDNLGLLAIETGEYGKSDSLYNVALNLINNQDSQHYYIGVINYHFGESKLESNQQNHAKLYLEKSLNQLKNRLGVKQPHLALVWNHFGRYYTSEGQFDNVAKAYEKAIFYSNLFFKDDHIFIGLIKANQVELFIRSGKYVKADSLLTNVFKVYKKSYGNSTRLALLYGELGKIKEKLGDYKSAIFYYEKVLSLLTSNSINITKSYVNNSIKLANVYSELNQIRKSKLQYEKSIKLIISKFGKKNIQYIVAIINLGDLYYNQDSIFKAEKLYLEAIPIIEEVFNKSHELYASCTFNLAWVYQRMEKMQLAEHYFLATSRLDEKNLGRQHPDYVLGLYGIANFYRRAKKNKQAFNYFRNANSLQKNLIQHYFSGFEEKTRLIYINEAMINYEDFFSYLTEESENLDSTFIQAQSISLFTKGLSLDHYKSNVLLTKITSDSILTQMYEVYQKEKHQLGNAYSLSAEERNKIRIDIEVEQRRVNLLEKKMVRRAKIIGKNLSEFKEYSFHNLQQTLKNKEISVDFIHFDYFSVNKRTDTTLYYALLTQKNASTPHLIPLCQEKDLKKLLKLSNQYGAGYTKYPEIGQKLYELVWQPLAPYLKDIETIHLSPTGLLHKVAFGGLPYKDGQLLDEFQINYYGNLRDFINKQPVEIPKSIALAGGAYFDIDSTDLIKMAQQDEELAFVQLDSLHLSTPIASVSRAIASDSTRNAIEFNYLPGTKKEVEQLAAAFEKDNWQTVTYTGPQASEDNIKILEGKNAPGILHLATHGYFFDPYEKQEGETLSDETMRERIIGAESPLLRSGLVFSGVNHSWKGGKPIAGLEDGVLTAFEIANMELWNTKLVVLSACETGLGDVESAEGVFGLQRAFKAAGVEKLVISLWKIPDAQTAELMQLFYENFLSGMDLAQALRTAQLKMSEQYDPFYWAGFILIE